MFKVRLPAGAGYITFATIEGNDGPNLDQVELTLVKADSTTSLRHAAGRLNIGPKTRVRLFTLTGQLLRETVGRPVSTVGLHRGVYLMQSSDGSRLHRQVIQVR